MADAFVAISQRSLDDLHRLHPATAEVPGRVVHLGGDHVLAWPAPTARARRSASRTTPTRTPTCSSRPGPCCAATPAAPRRSSCSASAPRAARPSPRGSPLSGSTTGSSWRRSSRTRSSSRCWPRPTWWSSRPTSRGSGCRWSRGCCSASRWCSAPSRPPPRSRAATPRWRPTGRPSALADAVRRARSMTRRRARGRRARGPRRSPGSGRSGRPARCWPSSRARA